MSSRPSHRYILFLAAILSAASLSAQSAPKVTSPKDFLGFNLGDDYMVANYTQLEAYWKKLASESDRMKLVSIGKTEEGRDQWMAIISSPENIRNLEKYKQISRRLALAEGVNESEAHQLAAQGKSVVWIDGGLHASESVGSQQLMEMVYQMVSRTDPETMRLLNDDILLCVQANPDGQELIANWYMRGSEKADAPLRPPEQREMNNLPRLYAKYVGHDDNRDFYMSNMKETTNMNRVLFLEWFPQIMYNHHQTGPAGAVIFIPPFRDPFNYNFDPLVPLGIEMVGTAMHSRLVAEGKGGSAMRSGSSYSTWWNGGLHHHLLPQHDRHPHRDHRQPHAHDDSGGSQNAIADRRLAHAGDARSMALPSIDRLRNHQQSRHPRPRLALPRNVPVQHLAHGHELH